MNGGVGEPRRLRTVAPNSEMRAASSRRRPARPDRHSPRPWRSCRRGQRLVADMPARPAVAPHGRGLLPIRHLRHQFIIHTCCSLANAPWLHLNFGPWPRPTISTIFETAAPMTHAHSPFMAKYRAAMHSQRESRTAFAASSKRLRRLRGSRGSRGSRGATAGGPSAQRRPRAYVDKLYPKGGRIGSGKRPQRHLLPHDPQKPSLNHPREAARRRPLAAPLLFRWRSPGAPIEIIRQYITRQRTPH
jgi:hypothetical protein